MFLKTNKRIKLPKQYFVFFVSLFTCFVLTGRLIKNYSDYGYIGLCLMFNLLRTVGDTEYGH